MPNDKLTENPPLPPHDEHKTQNNNLPEDQPCHCCDKCKCKHKGAKLVAALIIFFAGFGLAMMCRCLKYSSMDCPHHYAMMKKHAMMMPNYTDGAGNVIIINTDGSRPMMHQKSHKSSKQPQPAAISPHATPQMIPAMPMVNDEDFE